LLFFPHFVTFGLILIVYQKVMSENNKTTPLLEQYFEIKNKHPDTILLFQVGDFFELFFDDAKLVSQALSITLTKRGKHKGADIPICGVPVSSLTYHLTKLVKQGFRVAVCQQVSRPIPGEIVQRKVTRVLTPGTLTEASMLDEKTSSYLCAFWPCGDEWGVLFAELLGAKLFATKIMGKRLSSLDSELARFFPDEILLPHLEDAKSLQLYLTKKGYCTNFTDPAWEGVDLLERGAPSIENYSFGNNACLRSYFENKLESSVFAPLLQHPCLEGSFALLASYLHTYHDNFLPSVEEVKFYQPEDFLVLDNVTLKNLEVVRNNYDGSSAHTLFSAIDRCKTGMGSRALKQALLFPLKNKQLLQQRADFVQTLLVSFINLSRLEEFCATLCDLERIVGRIALARAGWQDYL
jgi:DNA mismatch repair protein MutS